MDGPRLWGAILLFRQYRRSGLAENFPLNNQETFMTNITEQRNANGLQDPWAANGAGKADDLHDPWTEQPSPTVSRCIRIESHYVLKLPHRFSFLPVGVGATRSFLLGNDRLRLDSAFEPAQVSHDTTVCTGDSGLAAGMVLSVRFP